MANVRVWLATVRGWLRRDAIADEIREELRFHVDMRTEEYRRSGLSSTDARRAAAQRFGNPALMQDRAYEVRGGGLMETLWQDLRFGARMARRAPLFSALAVLMLALGLGANVALYSLVKSVLLDALPYTEPDRLVRLYSQWDRSPGDRQSLSPGVALDVGSRVRAFSSVGAFNFSTIDVTYLDNAGARVLEAAVVDGRFFPTLGVRAALGRTLNESDAGTPAVVLSDLAWRRELNGDPSAVGRVVQINSVGRHVVGVLPAGFIGPMGQADIWLPLNLRSALRDPATARGQHWLGVIGRLAPGATAEVARAELAALAATLGREHTDTDRGRQFRVLPIREALVGATRTPLLLLMLSAALVLVIASANLSGAWLSRILARREELQVRLALGAARARIIRQLLTESVLLALTGAGVGLALAYALLGGLRRLAPPQLPSYVDFSLDGGAVAFAVAAALAAGLVFGVSPALAASRGWSGTLRDATRTMSESRGARRLRGVLLACQVALSLILVTGAGLLARNAAALASAPLGVTPDGVLVAGIQLPSSRYPGSEKATAFYRTLEDDVRAVPGVVAVATVSQLPSSTMSANALTVEGRTTTVDTPTFIPYMSVSDDYFRAVGLQVLQGRTFDAQDGSDAPPAVVVSRTFANRYWDGHAVGKRLRVSPHTSERWGVIIGIVEDVRLDPTRTDIEPLAYGAYRQDQGWVSRTLVVRTTGDPLHLVRPVQAALSRLDPTLPLRNPSPLQDLIDQRLLVQRVPAGLMVGFAVLALLVTAVGVYAMFASMTAARLQEFGIRLALGAGRGSIARLVFQQGAVWMAAGVAGGIAAMIAILPVVRSVASAPSSGGLPLVIGLGLILGSAGLALVVPILRATRVNPIDVLRST